jgi:hypothetical protein
MKHAETGNVKMKKILEQIRRIVARKIQKNETTNKKATR